MKYEEKIINHIKEIISKEETKEKYKMKTSDFVRNRKMPFEKVVYYNLNKKGLTSKMEIIEFDEIVNTSDISSPGVLKQREKLNANIYIDIMQNNIKTFYNEYKEDVKLFKEYILTATDGSDIEVPNTKITRERYKSHKNNTSAARAHISNSFDILNHYVLSTVIGPENDDEKEMDQKNLKEIKSMKLPYEIIRVKDRGYVSLKDMYYSNEKDDKYVTRLKTTDFKKQVEEMKTGDEIIEIPYQYDRVRYYKKTDEEFYKIMEESKPTIKVRCVKIELLTGGEEILITNLTKEEVTTEEMNELYRLRWQIETNYHTLKESLKIETITSSKEELIKQDIYSQMLAFNILQAFVNRANTEIDQRKYKNKMKINMNMAVGFFKKFFLMIMIEEDKERKNELLEMLDKRIKEYLIPIKDGRSYLRKKNVKNKYHINKRKSF